MKALNPNQIETIRRDVLQAGLSIQSLQEELIDHICCEVESMMDDQISFESAYAVMLQKTGITVLQQLQEDTYLLIYKNYALMKTTMKWSGIFSLSAIACATLMRILQFNGSNVLLVIGFVLLTFLFLPATVFLDYSTHKDKSITKRISLLAGCLLLCNGMLFKVMYWNGASVMILAGSISLLFVFLPQVWFSLTQENLNGIERKLVWLGILSLMIFSIGIVFKLFHWPGAGVMFVSGSLILLGVFVPLYSVKVLMNKERSVSQFIYLVILSVYIITMTGLISLHKTELPVAQKAAVISHSSFN